MAASSIASSLGRTIKTVTVIGGGLMGSGIAQASLPIKGIFPFKITKI
jgi:3-hydroxyacyl-CoA dehydrogenase